MTTDTKESVAKVANGKTIALVGLMGAGKSSVGRRVAEALSLPFYDSDEQIDLIASACAARIEEGAQSSEHLLDYEVVPFQLPESSEPLD